MLIGMSGLANSGKDTAANFMVERHGHAKVALADPIKRFARDLYAFTDQQLWGPSQFRNEPDTRFPREHGPWVELFSPVGYRTESNLASAEQGAKCACCGASGIDSQCFLTPRHVLQQIGTELGRSCYPNTWVDLCIRTAKTLLVDSSARYDQKLGIHPATADIVSAYNSRIRGVSVSDVRFLNEIDAIQAAGGKVIRIVRPGAGLAGVQGQHLSETEQAGIPDSKFDAIITNDGSLDVLKEAVEAIL
jgi:hypothetical protein